LSKPILIVFERPVINLDETYLNGADVIQISDLLLASIQCDPIKFRLF